MTLVKHSALTAVQALVGGRWKTTFILGSLYPGSVHQHVSCVHVFSDCLGLVSQAPAPCAALFACSMRLLLNTYNGTHSVPVCLFGVTTIVSVAAIVDQHGSKTTFLGIQFFMAPESLGEQ